MNIKRHIKKIILGLEIVAAFTTIAGAFVSMNKVPRVASTSTALQAFEFQATLTTFTPIPANLPLYGDWIMIPAGVANLSVTVMPCANGCAAKVQTTTDPEYTVQTDTNNAVTQIDWIDGVVSSTTTDAAKPVTAIRLVMVSTGTVAGSTGTATISVRAQ